MFGRLKEMRELKRIADKKMDTAFFLRKAAISGEKEKVAALLNECHRDPEVVNKTERHKFDQTKQNGPTALINAARHGHIEIVKILLDVKGVDLNAVDHLRPVIESAKPGVSAFRPDFNEQKDYWHNNALHAAAVTKHVDIVELLAAQPGMDVNAACMSGKTPLMLVVDYCPAALPALLKVTDLEVNAQDHEKRTALHLACLRRNPLEERLPAYIKLLLDVPDLDKNMVDAHGYTPMMYALKRKDAVLVEELQRAGVEIPATPATMRM